MDKYRESRGSFASASSAPKKASNYGSDFLRLSKVISNNIQKIQSNVRQMKTMLNDLERTPEDTRKLSQLHEVQQKTNALVKDTGTYMQDLNNIPKGFEGTGQRQQRLQKERLVSQFTKTVDDFQVVQKQEKEKTKEQVVRDKKSVKRYKESLMGPLDEEEPAIAKGQKRGQQTAVLVVQMEVTDIELELMREREEELRKLEADIMDVNEIFRDLGAMIHEQGEVLDTIESNVEATAASVADGTKELQTAKESQMLSMCAENPNLSESVAPRTLTTSTHSIPVIGGGQSEVLERGRLNMSKARRKKCIIIIIVSVILAIIIIIIVLASVLSKRD